MREEITVIKKKKKLECNLLKKQKQKCNSNLIKV